MKKYLLLGIVVCLIVVAVLYLKSGGKKIDVSIPEGISSIKQIEEFSSKYVDEYWGNRKRRLVKITMILDKNLKGNILILYTDEKYNRNGVHNSILVEIDTVNNKIVEIRSLDKDDKIEPDGEIDLDNWVLDNKEALDIAVKAVGKNSYPEMIIGLADSGYNGVNKQIWGYSLWYKSLEKQYSVKIDPFTGEILECEETITIDNAIKKMQEYQTSSSK